MGGRRVRLAELGRNILIGISFVNLCFFKVWAALLTYSHSDTYLMKGGAERIDYLAAIVNTLLLGTLLGLAITRAQPYLKGRVGAAGEWLLLLALLIPLNAIRAVAVTRWGFLHRDALIDAYGVRTVIAAVGMVGVVGMAGAFRWRHALARAVSVLLAVLSVFAALNVARGVARAVMYDPNYVAGKPLAARLANGRTSPRIVWAIFDEWDYRLTFENRMATVRMPEVDRLRGEVFFASNAYPPAGQTPWSLPALTTGHLVRDTVGEGPDDALLYLEPRDKPAHWSALPNTFAEAHGLGYNVGVVGFYHPYCRIFHNDLCACSWWPTALQYNSMGNTFREVLPNQMRSLFENDAYSVFGQSLAAKQHAHIEQQGIADAVRLVSDPGMGFVFLHLAIPHAPFVYDRRTGQFTLHNSPISGYWDNLALLDRAVGEIRSAMERAGLWDRTTVLLSSDHWDRVSEELDGKKDHHIPFLVKMAGEHEGMVFDHPFNTVLSHDLMLALMHGEVTNTAELAQWLDRHRTFGDSPLNVFDKWY